MLIKAIVSTVIFGTALVSVSSAFAGKLEKVDGVKEGIDQKPIVVRANSGGYTSYAPGTHRYYLRLYAKAKGSNAVWFVGVDDRGVSAVSPNPWFYSRWAGKTDGWSTFSKSISIDLTPQRTRFYFDPKVVCTENMKTQMNRGMSKRQVLGREWTLNAQARFYVRAAADSKKHNRKGDHLGTSDEKTKHIIYPVNVTCQRAS